MKLDQPLHALLGPDGKVLGDGECPCLQPCPFDLEDVDHARRVNGVEPRAAVVVLREADADGSER